MSRVVNIFYSLANKPGTNVLSIVGNDDNSGTSIGQFVDLIQKRENLRPTDYYIATGTNVYHPNTSNGNVKLKDGCKLHLCVSVCGGKGGFGSLLRAIGAQIEKTTNRDACRDLSGRRLRDVKREEELAKLVELQKKLVVEIKRRKKDKLAKLKQRYSAEGSLESSKNMQELVDMFEDKSYTERRLKIDAIVQAAVDRGMLSVEKKKVKRNEHNSLTQDSSCSQQVTCNVTNNEHSEEDDEYGEEKSTLPNKSEQPGALVRSGEKLLVSESSCTNHISDDPADLIVAKKKFDLWLGIDEDE